MLARFLLLMAFASLLRAQDVTEILKRFVEAQKINDGVGKKYTFTESVTKFELDKQGKPKPAGTYTDEIIFVEGEQYTKLVLRNGLPLPPKEQAQEEKKMKQTAAERRKARRNGLFHRETNIGTLDDLLTLSDCRIVGEEVVRGHKAWILEAVPKPGHKPANDREKEAMNFSKRFWIDQTEFVELREIDTVVGDKIMFKPGTVIRSEFEKIHDEAWLMTALDMDFRIQLLKVVRGSGRQEQRYSNFHKFDVQSTITVDEVK